MARRARPRRKTVTRWRTTDGREVPANTPGARPYTEQSRTWYGWVDGQLVPLGTEDEGQAWAELRKLLKLGGPVPRPVAKTLAQHVEDWLAAVEADGATPARVKLLRQRVAKLVALAGWRTLADLTAESCSAALAVLRRTLSARTRNHYLGHARQFCRWLVDVGRLDREPFRGIRSLNVDVDRRVVHRLPADAEMVALFDYLDSPRAAVRKGTRNKGPWQRMASGRQRALAYRVGMATGLRSHEIRTLSRESFDLAAATVSVVAGYSKRRRVDVLPLPGWLVGELRAWFDAGGETWQRWPQKAGEVLGHDLAGAGVPRKTAAGQFTWHSLRVWYCTQLGHQPGISPKVLMDLARHSTIQLTLATYAKSQEGPKREAVEKILPPKS